MKDGLLHKYIDHPLVKQLPQEEQEYLNAQLQRPWRYVFARIVDHPEEEFFVMRDEILGDDLLVFSPNIQQQVQDGFAHALFFLLVGNNGECWQTCGLISAFLSFTIDDIYLYATEVFPEVEDDEDFMKSVYNNPFPYYMLILGQQDPIVVNGNTVLKHYIAEQDITNLDTNQLQAYFNVQWNKGIYQFTLDEWQQHPHFAQAYYLEKEQLLYRYAMTRAGFDAITHQLIKAGLAIDEEEAYAVGLGMVTTMNQILKREFPVNPYEKFFTHADESAVPAEELDQMNQFLDY